MRDFDLVVKTGGFEFLRARQKRVAEWAGFVERAQVNGSGEAMEARIERVDER